MKTGTFTTTASGVSYPLHYKIWGDGNAQTLVCVHGLTRNSGDFKFVGEYMADRGYRVAAIDIAGRGDSSYYANPDDYNFDQYLKDIALFLKDIGCDKPASCDWLGVSMGGLLGLHLTGGDASPIRRLILSDVGPEVPQADMDLLSKFIRWEVVFNSLDEYIPLLKASIGTPYARGEADLDENYWRYMADINLRKNDAGKYIRNFDPNIAHAFETTALGQNNDLWSYWENTYQPTLALRGALSTLLTVPITEAMKTRKPNSDFQLETIAGAGHTPSLFKAEQVALIEKFLSAK
jgi:pimeloyl-ACP methyl ester carboxylesterase